MTSIAPLSPERAWPPLGFSAARAGARWDRGEAIARLFVLACFLPYPALAIGNKTGLQISHMMTIAALPLLISRPPRKALWALLLLAGPVYVSGFVNTIRDVMPEAEVIPKEAISLTMAWCVLWPSGLLADRRCLRSVMIVAAVAIVGHTLVGLYQGYAFSHDEFPLLFVFRNPSFKSMESWAVDYARYTKRPFGIFPEPSAMSASLSPFIVVLAGLLADPEAAARFSLGRRTRRLFVVALFSGFVLLAISRSGLSVPTMAAVLAVSIGKARDLVRALGPTAIFAGVALVGGVAAVMVYMAMSVGAGLDQRIESSWGIRTISIVTGLTANTEPFDLVFGVGPGQSTPIVRRMLANVHLAKTQDDMAIWSLAACDYMEAGLLGGAGMLAVVLMAARSIARSSAVVLGIGAAGTWALGVVVTTSYYHLSPIWLFLALLLDWDRIFVKGPRAGAVPE